jgi:hypothetical protein
MTIPEMYKSITGVDMPKPFAERTHEERVQAQNKFLASVAESDDDDAIDDLFRDTRMNLHLREPSFLDEEDADAA